MSSDRRAIPPLERLPTGSAALDRILGGGLPGRSVNVIAGAPGSGKTVFALQVLFHLARQGRKCLYFTTLSEPAIKLISYMQHFSFFDPKLLESHVRFIDLGTTVRKGSAAETLGEITGRVEQEEPSIVVIDSFKAIGDLIRDATHARTFVYDLAVHMASWGATTLLLGEYTDEEIGVWPEFAVADGIIRLASRASELTASREIDVLKLRGANYVTGRHFFEIATAGLAFYPRVRAPEQMDLPMHVNDRVSMGIGELDHLLGGGLPRTSSTIVLGGTGTGKTLLGLHYLVEGAQRGEPGVLFSLEETREQLRMIAGNYGWDLATLEAKGLLTTIYASPVELSTDRFLDQARQHAERLGARRAVLDSLTSMSLGVTSERRFKELVYALTKHFRASGITLLMNMEIPELLGSTMISGHGVSFAADNVIQLRYVEVGEHLERGISVLKARGIRHETDLRRVNIGAKGMEVGERYPTVRGVLTGDLASPKIGGNP